MLHLEKRKIQRIIGFGFPNSPISTKMIANFAFVCFFKHFLSAPFFFLPSGGDKRHLLLEENELSAPHTDPE